MVYVSIIGVEKGVGSRLWNHLSGIKCELSHILSFVTVLLQLDGAIGLVAGIVD